MLGRHWSVVFSDYIADAGGNRERLAFVFDQRRVTFTGLAGSAEGPRRRVGDEYRPTLEWWRPPFLASFRAGAFDFIVMAAHVRWGKTARKRGAELDALLGWLRERAAETYFGDKDVIAVGDFNVLAPARDGFEVAPGIGAVVTSVAAGRRYDQILCLPRDRPLFTGRGGAIDFASGGVRALFPRRRFGNERWTWQLSDHLPLWAELEVA